jgi:alpha-tubulin suppressor-like RCC1 family protein
MSLTFTAAVRSNKPKRNVAFIKAGSAFSIALQKNGRAWGWGSNAFGQLGDNSSILRLTPVSVLGTVKTFCQISTGVTYSLAIDKNGRAWGWGVNGSGQLGNNSVTQRLTPVSVLGGVKTFCQISAGDNHSLAIDKNGRAWGWGGNGDGQLGDNSVTSRLTPVSVLGTVKTFCQINIGLTYSLAIDKNGRVWGWGNNAFGQLGDNSVTSRRTPVSVLGAVKTFCKVEASNGYSLAIDKNGRVWGWGINTSGQLGNNSVTSRRTPVSVLGGVKTFCQISAGNNHSLAIDKNGRAWGWGNNGSGELGDNSATSRLTPVSVLGGVKTFCQISGGGTHSLAIDKNGRSWGWGEAIYIGINVTLVIATPVSVLGAVKTFCQIISGYDHVCVIDKNGRAWAWGQNPNGGIGDNSTTSRLTPVSVLGAAKTFCRISGGKNFSLALDKNGRAWGWGYNTSGQVGDNSTTSRLTPVSVLGAVKTFCYIHVGEDYSLSIDKNGRAWAWGRNGYGTLGDNSITNRLTPVSIAGAVKTFCKISGAFFHSLAIDKNGRAWGWGYSFYGVVGNGSEFTSILTPVSVTGAVKTFCQISAGTFHSLSIDKNGRAWGWGYNGYGQLGNDLVTQSLTPVSVLGGVKTFCQISAGRRHSLAIDKNGRAWGWGYNNAGQIGNDSSSTVPTPVSIVGAVKTFCKITALQDNSIAIDKNGRTWAWGIVTNTGTNKGQYYYTPVQICNI